MTVILSSSWGPVYFWPGDVSVCRLYQVVACLFVLSGVSLLLHPCCCVHERVLNDGKAETKQAPESLPVTWSPASGNSDYRGFHTNLLLQHFALNAVRIVFALCTPS